MKKDYLFINEVAKLHSLTKKTLLYYDRIDLFKPVYVDEETGYRYYSVQQLPFLKQIIYLKNLGFSLNDIQSLLDDREFPILLEKLSKRKVEVESEIHELENVNKDLDFLINYYQQVQFLDERDLNKPGIKLFNDRYAIYDLCQDENTVAQVMLSYRRLLRKLIKLNIFSQMPYGSITIENDYEKTDYYDILGAFITLPHRMNLDGEILVPAGKYAYMYKKGGYYDKESADFLLAWIEENGYKPVGNIYDYSLIDYTFTKSNEDMIQEIQIRIE